MTGKPSPAPPRSRGRPRLVLPEPDPPMAPASFKAWRERLHFTTAAAARELGISRNWAMKFESGAAPIPRHIALACAAIAHGLIPMR